MSPRMSSRPWSARIDIFLLCFLFFVSLRPAESACPRSWLTFNLDSQGKSKTCVLISTSKSKSFDRAQSYCGTLGGYLYRDSGQQVHNSLVTYLKSQTKTSTTTTYWIGLTDMNKDSGPWKWVGGSNLGRYNHWSGKPKNTKGKQDCAYIYTKDKTFSWRISTCGTNRGTICQRDFNARQPVTTPPKSPYTCPKYFTLYATRRTCIRLITSPSTWSNARKTCKMQKSDLVRIVDSRMNSFVAGLVAKQKSTYWIGLSDQKQEGQFKWLDDKNKATYVSWSKNEPNNFRGNEDCASTQSNGLWNDLPCTQKARFICQTAAKAPPKTTTKKSKPRTTPSKSS